MHANPLVRLSEEQREAILEKQIQNFAKKGFRVLSQTKTTAQLVKPKQFNAIGAFVLLVLFILPLVIYVLSYLGEQDQQLHLAVDRKGAVSVTGPNLSYLIDAEGREEFIKKPWTPGQRMAAIVGVGALIIFAVAVSNWQKKNEWNFPNRDVKATAE